jgi:diguanylate cyclase (GGDEF)-like protein
MMADDDTPVVDDGSDFSEEEVTAVVKMNVDHLSPQRRQEVAYLSILSGSETGELIKVTDGLTIGRSARAALRLQDEGISRLHVRLDVQDDGNVVAVDLNSSNGTYINGERQGFTTLEDGDKILIGTTTILKFSLADAVEETFQRRMYESSVTDGLTGLFNRRYLDAQLESEVSYTLRHGVPLCLVMLDIDHFKRINDRHGHPAGDQVLVALGELIRGDLRKEDLPARFGGEEFVIICRGISIQGGMALANRLLAKVKSARFLPQQPELAITISAGVAFMPSPTIATATDLLEAADQALYQAKQGGRDRVCSFIPRRG